MKSFERVKFFERFFPTKKKKKKKKNKKPIKKKFFFFFLFFSYKVCFFTEINRETTSLRMNTQRFVEHPPSSSQESEILKGVMRAFLPRQLSSKESKVLEKSS